MAIEERTCAAADGDLWTVRERPSTGVFRKRPAVLVFQKHWIIVELADYPSDWKRLDDEALLSLVPLAPVERAD